MGPWAIARRAPEPAVAHRPRAAPAPADHAPVARAGALAVPTDLRWRALSAARRLATLLTPYAVAAWAARRCPAGLAWMPTGSCLGRHLAGRVRYPGWMVAAPGSRRTGRPWCIR